MYINNLSISHIVMVHEIILILNDYVTSCRTFSGKAPEEVRQACAFNEVIMKACDLDRQF